MLSALYPQTAEPVSERQAISRNLPSWALDIIAHGIEKSDSRVPLFQATHSIACAAVARGWTEQDFVNILMDGVKDGKPKGKPSKGLWEQLTHRRHRPVRLQTVMTMISKAWAWAVDNIAKGRRPTQDREVDLLAVAEYWFKALDDPHNPRRLLLSPSEEGSLRYVIDQVCARKYRNVTAPCRAVGEYAGISYRAAYKALKELADLGILDCLSPGTWKGLRKNHGGKAAIYRLADPDRLQGTPTLPHEKPSDQHLPNVGTHITWLQGADMCTSLSLTEKTEQKPLSEAAIRWLRTVKPDHFVLPENL